MGRTERVEESLIEASIKKGNTLCEWEEEDRAARHEHTRVLTLTPFPD